MKSRLPLVGSIILIMAAVSCTLGAIISGFAFTVRAWPLILTWLTASIMLPVLAGTKKRAGLLALAPVVIGLLLWKLPDIINGAKGVIFYISSEFNKWLYVSVLFNDTVISEETVTVFFAAVGVALVCLLYPAFMVWRSSVTVIAMTAPLVCLTFVLIYFQPNPWFLAGLLAVYLTVILCNAMFREGAAIDGRGLGAAGALAAGVMLISLFAVSPSGYVRAGYAAELDPIVRGTVEKLGLGKIKYGSGWPSVSADGLWRFDVESVGIADAGFRTVSDNEILEVSATKPGTYYLRGYSMQQFDGRSWTVNSDKLELAGELVSRAMPAAIILEYGTYNRSFAPESASMSIRKVGAGRFSGDMAFLPYYSFAPPVSGNDSYNVHFYETDDNIADMAEVVPLTEVFFRDNYLTLYNEQVNDPETYLQIDVTTAHELRRLARVAGIYEASVDPAWFAPGAPVGGEVEDSAVSPAEVEVEFFAILRGSKVEVSITPAGVGAEFSEPPEASEPPEYREADIVGDADAQAQAELVEALRKALSSNYENPEAIGSTREIATIVGFRGKLENAISIDILRQLLGTDAAGNASDTEKTVIAYTVKIEENGTIRIFETVKSDAGSDTSDVPEAAGDDENHSAHGDGLLEVFYAIMSSMRNLNAEDYGVFTVSIISPAIPGVSEAIFAVTSDYDDDRSSDTSNYASGNASENTTNNTTNNALNIAINKERAIIAAQVARYISSSASYTLTPYMVPKDEDFTLYFLEQSKQGYCIHFATAATLMLRALHVPARITSGFLVTIPAGGAGVNYTVTDRNAHAWVEVYYNDIGWIPLEVTPSSPGSSLPAVSTPSGSYGGRYSDTPEDDYEEMMPWMRDRNNGGTSAQTPEPDAAEAGSGGTVLLVVLCIALLCGALMLYRRHIRGLRNRRFTQADANAAVMCVWRYISRIDRDVSPAEEFEQIAMKARFSQHRISEDERGSMINYSHRLTKEVYANKDVFGRLWLKWGLAI